MSLIVKNTTLPNPLALLAPHSCRGCGQLGKALCNCCKNYIVTHRHSICPICQQPTLRGTCTAYHHPPIYIVDQRSELIGELIHDFKYNSVRALAHPLAEILHLTLPQIKTPVIIVPLPTINKHIRARGLDHTLLIAKQLTKLRGPDYRIQQLLIRATNTVQVGSDRKTRLLQAESTYTLAPRSVISKTATYLLLDDVWTTGASMLAAAKKLRQAGAQHISISILALSRLD